ncbi:MAG: alpha/beta hydrolase [Aquabacterium sp.]
MNADTTRPPGPDAKLEWRGHSGPLLLRLYRGSPSKTSDTLLVFFAPGGFVVADLDEADHCLRVLAETCGVSVLAPCYALAPNRPFPAAVEDAHSVLSQVARNKQQLGWKGTRLFVGGVEAGGNLAAVSALVCRDRQGPSLEGQILVTPMLDANLRCPSMRCATDDPDKREMVRAVEDAYRQYLPRPADRLHPYASPLNASRLSGLPRSLILHTKEDPLSDEAIAYAEKLRQAGNEVTDLALPPPPELHDNKDRCELTADDPCVLAMKDFMTRPTVEPRPARSSST